MQTRLVVTPDLYATILARRLFPLSRVPRERNARPAVSPILPRLFSSFRFFHCFREWVCSKILAAQFGNNNRVCIIRDISVLTLFWHSHFCSIHIFWCQQFSSLASYNCIYCVYVIFKHSICYFNTVLRSAYSWICCITRDCDVSNTGLA